MSTSAPILHLTTAMLLLLLHSAAATDHIVGANRGWNPGINYTLWANNHTFYVGDFISFRYQKQQYNVFEVNKTGYDNCTLDGATGNWSSGKDFILLNQTKRYYFICGNGGCFSGMKVSILVHPLLSPSPSVERSNHTSPAAGREGRGVLGVVCSVVGYLYLVGMWVDLVVVANV